MFNRGKESATVFAGQPIDKKFVSFLQTQERAELQVPALPDAIDSVLKDAVESFDEYTELVGVKSSKSLPRGQKEAYDARLRRLEVKMAGANNVVEAIKAGYEPFSMPEQYYAGAVSQNETSEWDDNERRIVVNLHLVFGSPMPARVLEEYEKAQRSKLFNQFVVASPDRSVFRMAAPLRVDPILLGFVKNDTDMTIVQQADRRFEGGTTIMEPHKGLIVRSATPFLIAHWDLHKDLQHLPK